MQLCLITLFLLLLRPYRSVLSHPPLEVSTVGMHPTTLSSNSPLWGTLKVNGPQAKVACISGNAVHLWVVHMWKKEKSRLHTFCCCFSLLPLLVLYWTNHPSNLYHSRGKHLFLSPQLLGSTWVTSVHPPEFNFILSPIHSKPSL